MSPIVIRFTGLTVLGKITTIFYGRKTKGLIIVNKAILSIFIGAQKLVKLKCVTTSFDVFLENL